MIMKIAHPMLPQLIVAIKKFLADLDCDSTAFKSPWSFALTVSHDLTIPIIPEKKKQIAL